MDRWIPRDAAEPVERLARSFPAILVAGPRQVGKTSLLRRLFPGATYVTFDDLALARQAETEPRAFFDRFPEPLLLDEVQYVPGLMREIKLRIDRRRAPGRFLMTGSQTFPLMQGVSESLAGRCGIFELASLSLREVRGGADPRDELEVLVRGGYPELYTGAIEAPGAWYSAYVATYLERDVRNLKAVGDLRDFDRFVRAAAVRTGQLLSYADLARDVGVAPNTAKAWVSVLQASGQVLLLEPYHRSLGKRLTKSPKLYFMDTGLACHLLGIDSRASLLASPLAGALWETFVVGQVARQLALSGSRPPIWFWRVAGGEEVDLLIERGGRFIAIECKMGEHPGPEALRGFRALRALYGDRAVLRSLVVCRTGSAYGFAGDPGARAVDTAEAVRSLAVQS